MVATISYPHHTAVPSFWSSQQDSLLLRDVRHDAEIEEDADCFAPHPKKMRTNSYVPASTFALLPLELLDEVSLILPAEYEEAATQFISYQEEEELTVPSVVIPIEVPELIPEEQATVSLLLDSERNVLGTIELSFLDKDDSAFLGTLPDELIVRESYNMSLWQFLRMDPSTPLCFAKFVEAGDGGAGVPFRSVLWQSRKSAVIDLPDGWEMHLVAESADADQHLTGYLCPSRLPLLLAQREMDKLLESRKLAAAIDIDDTLVKSIPPHALSDYPPERLKGLKNIPLTIAVSSEAEYFLRKASRKFRLSLYSLGTSEYVREVAEVLDPEHTIFDWDSIASGISSARHELLEAGECSPKRLERVFAFANNEDGSVNHSMCLAVDDNPEAWAVESRKQVMKVETKNGGGVWNSSLKRIWRKMQKHHRRFYKARKVMQSELSQSSEEEQQITPNNDV